MQNWKITLSYDGTRFFGWQVQPGLPTVQGVLSSALTHITGETVLPQGSGRTDAGVHALGQVVSFALSAEIPEGNLLRALNRALPASVRVLAVEHVEASFHARHSAVRKSYEYRIFAGADTICSPLLAPFCWDCHWRLDWSAAAEAACAVVGEHDFRSFAASDPDLTRRTADGVEWSTVRTIYASSWSLVDGLLVYRVTGSGFLHHMVRNLVGTFVDVARGRTEVKEVSRILAARNRAAAGPTAPARGLFLMRVDY